MRKNMAWCRHSRIRLKRITAPVTYPGSGCKNIMSDDDDWGDLISQYTAEIIQSTPVTQKSWYSKINVNAYVCAKRHLIQKIVVFKGK